MIEKWALRTKTQFTGHSSASWARHRLSYSAVSIQIVYPVARYNTTLKTMNLLLWRINYFCFIFFFLSSCSTRNIVMSTHHRCGAMDMGWDPACVVLSMTTVSAARRFPRLKFAPKNVKNHVRHTQPPVNLISHPIPLYCGIYRSIIGISISTLRLPHGFVNQINFLAVRPPRKSAFSRLPPRYARTFPLGTRVVFRCGLMAAAPRSNLFFISCRFWELNPFC